MNEPIITCPNCKTPIHLTESLAAPLIEATRQQYEQKMAQMTNAVNEREQNIKEKEKQLQQTQQNISLEIEKQVTQLLQEQKTQLINETTQKAQKQSAVELEQKALELKELQAVLQERDQKLLQAQAAQAEFLKKQRELDDAKRELELTVEKRVQETIQEVRNTARKEVEESLKLKILEKDQTIASMQQKIEELKQKAEQGSQQLQGEVQEIALENTLRTKFIFDQIEPVAKGEFGGDILQKVINPSGISCGSILWEAKRTKHWNDAWLTKLRDDQRAAKADIAIIVSQVLPHGIETFDVIDGVWVVSSKVAIPVATMLRESLIKVNFARQASEGLQTKTEMVYQYLTGPRFRHRVEAIVEAFTSMQDDLNKEKKAITKQWAKREEQIERVMQSTIGMYGDLQGIAGQSLQEIKGLELDSFLLEQDN